MDIGPEKRTVMLYEVKCRLCEKIMRSAEKGGCQKLLSDHIDNECKVVQTMRAWEKQGIYKQMMGFLKEDALIKDLKKLLMHYTSEEIRHSLELME